MGRTNVKFVLPMHLLAELKRVGRLSDAAFRQLYDNRVAFTAAGHCAQAQQFDRRVSIDRRVAYRQHASRVAVQCNCINGCVALSEAYAFIA